MGEETDCEMNATEALEREFSDGLSKQLIESYREVGTSDEEILRILREWTI